MFSVVIWFTFPQGRSQEYFLGGGGGYDEGSGYIQFTLLNAVQPFTRNAYSGWSSMKLTKLRLVFVPPKWCKMPKMATQINFWGDISPNPLATPLLFPSVVLVL